MRGLQCVNFVFRGALTLGELHPTDYTITYSAKR